MLSSLRPVRMVGILLAAWTTIPACRREARWTAASPGRPHSASAARAANEAVLHEYIDALDRHDVEGQYRQYSPEMLQSPQGPSLEARKDKSRNEREFEAASNARWKYEVVGAGTDSLEAIVTESMDFYDALGVGPRSHRARYRFHNGKIADIEARDWTQPGRPYEDTRDRFVAWLSKERPTQAARLMKDGRLVFQRSTAAEMTALAREWSALAPAPAGAGS